MAKGPCYPMPIAMQQPFDANRDMPARGTLVQHSITEFSENWVIEEGPVSESAWHFEAVVLLHALLRHWIATNGRNAAVFCDLAVRVMREKPQVGFSPDVIVVEPAPPGAHELPSLRLWEPGHVPPAFVIEIVSPGHPYKDYVDVPDQCAALGVRELIVFDPLRAGPKARGGPKLLQVWRRTEAGRFTRVDAGDGPFFSEFLGAYVVPALAWRALRFSSTPDGRRLWLTPEEAERAKREAERTGREAERAGREAERAEKERALARIAELEAELTRRR